MSKIFCVASIQSIGGTFIEWSINYLSGQDQYYSVKNQKWISLLSNPVSETNAHGHEKNHPAGFKQTVEYVKQLEKETNITSFYPCMLHISQAMKELNIELKDLTDRQSLLQIKQLQQQDYNQLLKYCAEKNIKIVYADLNASELMYINGGPRSLDRLAFSPDPMLGVLDKLNENDLVFYNHVVELWQADGLTEIWDQRERLALCTRPLDSLAVFFDINFSYPHCWLDIKSFWCHGDITIKKIMSYLELDIDVTRFNHWLSIYQDWKKIHYKYQEFSYNYKHIVDAIINNWYYELDDLTFSQEVVIQHLLIYQHGLNLKTWNLTKFPNNTQELHKLLEPNIHPI